MNCDRCHKLELINLKGDKKVCKYYIRGNCLLTGKLCIELARSKFREPEVVKVVMTLVDNFDLFKL